MKSLVWLRSDLRLSDNPALMAACKNHEEVHAVYIFSKNQLNSHNESNVKVDFINFSYLENFLVKFDYEIYNTKFQITSLEKVLTEINKLPNNMYGIGNNFLIKKGSKIEKIIKNV